MTRFETLLFATLALLPFGAQAGSVIGVSKPELCAQIAGLDTADQIFLAVDQEASVISFTGMFEIEYHCNFADVIDMSRADEDPLQTFTGYCEEPGPFVEPTVFAVDLRHDEGELHLWQSGLDTATVFTLCR